MRHLHKDIATSASVDLHVLGTPPTFVLSQDQTLRSNFYFNTLEFDFFNRLNKIFKFYCWFVDETQEEITHTNFKCLRVKIVERT